MPGWPLRKGATCQAVLLEKVRHARLEFQEGILRRAGPGIVQQSAFQASLRILGSCVAPDQHCALSTCPLPTLCVTNLVCSSTSGTNVDFNNVCAFG